ncbi:MAG: pentapeptide repeat-containing protein [Pseudomonadota bacterium]
MRFLSVLLIGLLTAAAPAMAQQAQPKNKTKHVTFAPSLGGKCITQQLTGSNFVKWNLKKAHCAGAVLANANLHGVQAQETDFTGIIAPRAKFVEANVSNAKFGDADLQGANLHGAEANGADFTKADLQSAIFIEAKLIGAILHDADASGMHGQSADFSGGNLTGTRFDGAHLQSASFDGAVLENTKFRGAFLHDASFRDARLIAADLSASLGYKSAIFDGACISQDTRLPRDLELPICADLIEQDEPISLLSGLETEP